MLQKTPPKKQIIKNNENNVEAKYTSFKDMLDAGDDNSATDAWREFFGGFDQKIGEQLQIFGSAPVDMRPGEEMSLKNTKTEKKSAVATEAHMEYFRGIKNADIAPEKQKDMQIQQKVEEIRLELKALMKESKQLEATFKTIQIEQKIVNAGTYHENLFDVIRGLIRLARMKVQEGISWAGVAKGKKQQKEYWNMFQKHGTTFGLSQERTVSTQTG